MTLPTIRAITHESDFMKLIKLYLALRGSGQTNKFARLVLWFRRLRLAEGNAKLVRHAHQVDRRFRLHFVHYIAAVNLYGHLAQS